MFEKSEKTSFFGLPPGVDFPKEFVCGLRKRLKDSSPEAMAEIEIYVNSNRMRQKVKDELTNSDATILPRLLTLNDLSNDPRFSKIKPSRNPLGIRLELAQLISKFIELEPDMGSPNSCFELADSLANLIQQLHEEGLSPDTIVDLDVQNYSQYWARNKKFFKLINQYFDLNSIVTEERRQRLIIDLLEEKWVKEPPLNPIIIAGSTGSRGTTQKFIKLVTKLPCGGVILPGVDFDMSELVWNTLGDSKSSNSSIEDHPQYRLKSLLSELGIKFSEIDKWTQISPYNEPRNKLISLALQPAPVTDSWIREAPKLKNISAATQGITILEAPSERLEALSISLKIREALENKKSCTVITPNRLLARRISATLKQWRIEVDDAAGTPLSLSVSGRLFLKSSKLIGKKITSESFMALLKHPLVCLEARRTHLIKTRNLELSLLRGKAKFPNKSTILSWAKTLNDEKDTVNWVTWVFACLENLTNIKNQTLEKHIRIHFETTKLLINGSNGNETKTPWATQDGKRLLEVINELEDAAIFGGEMDPNQYVNLIYHVLSKATVRTSFISRPDIMIWGTQEARVNASDLVILGGLNDGVWPSTPTPDPWINRQMRRDAGLPLPERLIGLSAHDFQQAIASSEVWLTRSKRNSESETVPSRWLNRLFNLLSGLPKGQYFPLDEMRERGNFWLKLSNEFEKPHEQIKSSKRPSPQPPVSSRPKKLSVTQIERLIRDPYAIYAKHILKLVPLKPLSVASDAALRGQAIHKIMEQLIKSTLHQWPNQPHKLLIDISREVLEVLAPSLSSRVGWQKKIDSFTDAFISSEGIRRKDTKPILTEVKAEIEIKNLNFILNGVFDRVDQKSNGDLIIYDYKTGLIPSEKKQEYFDKQLQLLALILVKGGIKTLNKKVVKEAYYIDLSSRLKDQKNALDNKDLIEVFDNFCVLISSYNDRSRGYSARRAVFETRWEGEYDHLSRFGEWDHTQKPESEVVGE